MDGINYVAAPTASKFHRSNALVRSLRGPIGTGKSVTCCMEIIRRGVEQIPYKKVRRSRWAAVRNSYPELISTTIKTWEVWVPDAVTVYSAPINSVFRRALPDGTTLEIEVLFMSLDRPADVKKLKSLDLTGIWLNEASELPKAVLDMATGRVGRYPAKEYGGFNWSGVIMDTNSPDDDHWLYELAETTRPEGYEFFAQPGALMKSASGAYVPNPDAENVNNHTLGYEYWLRQVPGKSEQWIKVYILGQYGTVHDGKPVYQEWNDSLHTAELYPLQGVKLIIGVDFGLTPAAVITQTDPRGRLLVLDELCGEDIGFEQFLEDSLIPYLITNYPHHWAKKDEMILLVGDPAGEQRSQSNERTCFQEAKAKGLKIKPAKSNAWLARRGAVAWYLTKLAGGKAMLLIDVACGVLRKGFNGGYKYRRIQVTGEERFTEEPSKNKYSHPHDALQYAALEAGGAQALTKQEVSKPRVQPFRPTDPGMGMLG